MSKAAGRRGWAINPIAAVYPATLCAVATFLALGVLKVGVFYHVSGGLDTSWAAAIGEAATRHDHFGRDIIFTGSTLSPLYTRYFNPLTWSWVTLLGIFAAGSLGVSFAALRPSPLAVALFVAALVVANTDALFMVVALAAGLTVLQSRQDNRGALVMIPLLMGAVAAAGLTLAKFSVAPIALVIFATADVLLLLRQRRVPLALATFLLSLFVLFGVTDGDAAAFPAFLRYSIETSAGYAAAMGMGGDDTECLVYLLAAVIFFGIIVFVEGVSRRWGAAAIAVFIMLGVYVFVSFKAGFVRHDLHSLSAWSGLGMAAALYACVSWRMHRRAAPRFALGAVVWATIAVMLQLQVLDDQKPWTAALGANITAARQAVTEIVAMIADRPAWLARRMSERAGAAAALRAAAPLPALDGTVDILTSEQARLIANGLDYRPRFTVQEYTSYTPELIEKNRAFLLDPAAPKYIFAAPGSIDGRYPASAEGASWPDFLRLYATQEFAGDLLLLKRRDRALAPLLGPEEKTETALGTPFAIPPGPVFMTIDIRPNWFGKLAALLFKPPDVTLNLKDESGRQRGFRLIPGQATAGFLVSPMVVSARDMAALWAGPAAVGRLPRQVEVTLTTVPGGQHLYASAIRVTMQQVDVTAAQTALPASP